MTNTPSLLNLVTKHLLHIIAGIYVSRVVARLLGRLWPEVQLLAFILLSLGFILTGVSIFIRERQGGEDSTASTVIATIPVLIIVTAILIGLGKLTAHFWSDGMILAIIWSVMFCLTAVATVFRDALNKKRLDADLKETRHDALSDKVI